MKKVFCLVGLLWLVPLVQAQSKLTLEQVFANLDSVAKTFVNVQCDIERTHVTVVADLNDKEVTSGRFYYMRQGKEPRLKLELTKPEAQAQYLLIDNGKLQLYTPSLKTVREGSLAEHKDMVERIMALGFGQSSQDLKKDYDVLLGGEQVLEGKKTVLLNLVPKNKAAFKAVQMWFDPVRWLALQIKVTEPSNDYLIVKYSNISTNMMKSANGVFSLKLPKDVTFTKL